MPEKNSTPQSYAKSSAKSNSGLGFYKRRRGILEHLEAGTISLLDLAVHDYLNLKANLVVGSGSSLPPGVCITSATAIHATCPSQISERAIQRSLEHLEKIRWIKRWNVRGKRGNYPVLVCRASVHDLSGSEYRVNGEATTDWRNPVLEPVGDLSALSSGADAKLSDDREVRTEKKEGEEAAAAAAALPKGQTKTKSKPHPSWKAVGVKPCGTLKFCRGWEEWYDAAPEGEDLVDLMESFIQFCQAQKIPVPPPFYRAKHKMDAEDDGFPTHEVPDRPESSYRISSGGPRPGDYQRATDELAKIPGPTVLPPEYQR
jgi:hypothetical protein